MARHLESEEDSASDSSSTCSLEEDDYDYNKKLKPFWPDYQMILRSRGFRLDTVRDVKDFYQRYSESQHGCIDTVDQFSGYSRAYQSRDEDALCNDAGLPENLFRGCRVSDGAKLMVKAVHRRSREYGIIRFLSSQPQRDHPLNHCIPVLDFVETPIESTVLIIMEEWSPHLAAEVSCDLLLFLGAIRQCIEVRLTDSISCFAVLNSRHGKHIAFMHLHRIAHLDISLHNVLTDWTGRFAYIDFELSRRYDQDCDPRICGYRGTEVPPEVEVEESSNPYQIDIFALGVLILRAIQLTGHQVPELIYLVRPMINPNPEKRPSAMVVLKAFNHSLTRAFDLQPTQRDCVAQCT